VLFEDEASFYRQPSQGWLWAYMGRQQPKMRYSNRSNTRMRVVGFLDAVKGKVLSFDCSSVTVPRLRRCLEEVACHYQKARRIYIVWDNWPNHFHPGLQDFFKGHPNISVIALPTYAPWLNPIEKLWRLVRQFVTHAHPWCDDFSQFKNAVREQLHEFLSGSTKLLQYVGLLT